ncbi:C-type lectin domain family 4 member F-like [Penaeus chinensis]|uniref:C-type lectin domain family 4 member F-like n=1 Tax=Penaeus chinensis TaxID=139456 RepID=UPI001FB765A0|nr:C-type lectin domain family 4 member F-like [Penaeus chinensis]
MFPNEAFSPQELQSSLGLQGRNAPLGLGSQQSQQLPLLLLNLLASAVPLGFANPTQFASLEQIQPLVMKNLQSITEMNRNLFDVVEARKGRRGETKERCREKKLNIKDGNLAKGFLDMQDSSLALQMALSEYQLEMNPGKEVRGLIAMIGAEGGRQQRRLRALRQEQEEQEEDDEGPPAGCKEPYFAVGKECFFLAQEQRKSWHDARDACEALGTHLARPRDVRKLVAVLQDFPGMTNRVWIGASDAAREGAWRWLSGEPLDVHDWRPKQPSNRSASGEEQDCLSLVTKKYPASTMDDHSCGQKKAYLCEMDLEC